MPSLLGNLRSYFSKLVYLFKFKPPFLYNFDPEIRLRIQIYRLRYKKSLQNIGYHTNILEIANPKIFFHWDLGNLKLSSELELYSGGVLELKKPNKKYFSIPSILPEINAIPGISIIRPSLPKRQIIKHKEYNSHFLDLLLPECYKYSFYRLTLDDNFKCPPVQTTRFDKSSIELFAKQFSFFLLKHRKIIVNKQLPSFDVDSTDNIKISNINLIFPYPEIQLLDLSKNLNIISILQGFERIEPIKRGGAPRGKKKRTFFKIKFLRKPEIVCWKRETSWILGIEFSESDFSEKHLNISQGNEELNMDGNNNRRLLKKVSQTVEINEPPIYYFKLPLKKDYILFKLSGKNLEYGRRVSYISQGLYLVIAPETWERNEKESGSAPISPESVAIEGFSAHFFMIENNNNWISFYTHDHKKIVSLLKKVNFILEGNLIECVKDHVCPLYGNSAPRLMALDKRAWGNIGEIIIGEEGSGTVRWRKRLEPPEEQDENYIICDVSEKGDGWFFIRIYNRNQDLVESFDFHFIKKIKSILSLTPSPIPGPQGHGVFKLEITHDPECKIYPKDDSASKIEKKENSEKTILLIDADPNLDKSEWILGDCNKHPITLSADRIWWTICLENETPENWIDKPLSIKRSEFTATSNYSLWIMFPRKRYTKEIYVGFNRQSARKFYSKVDEKVISVPTREFCDCNEIGVLNQDHNLKLWTNEFDGFLNLISIKALLIRCKFCKFTDRKMDIVLKHIKNNHLKQLLQFYQEISDYEKLKQHDKSLPHKIYKCSYCDIYISCDDIINPTNAICLHQEDDCHKVERFFGIAKKKFRVINDANEIRKNVIKKLPIILECKFCYKIFKKRREKTLTNHILDSHKNILCQYADEV